MQTVIKKYISEIEKLNTFDDMEVLVNNIETIITKIISEVELCVNKNEYSDLMLKSEIFVSLLDEVGYGYATTLPEDNEKNKAEVLNRLFMINVKACREVVYLLKGGFANAALARIRFIFEAAVFIDIINSSDEEIAERFLKHSNTNRLKIAKRYNEQALKESIEKQLQDFDYGDSFYKDYQWASSLLNNKKMITFKDLAELSNLNDLYHLYCFCCDYTHANIYTSLYGIDIDKIEKGKSIWITTPSENGIEAVVKIFLLLMNRINTAHFKSISAKEILISLFLASIANINITFD